MNETQLASFNSSFTLPHSSILFVAWVILSLWLLGAALTILALVRQKYLKSAGERRLIRGEAPLVSVLVPARNEEHRILAECVRSILAQDYERFEVVAVNDRSTDATGAILRGLAAADRRLRVIEGREPPRGWLGKPFALQQALEAAGGEWVLATDADMIFHPAALSTAVECARGRKADALTLIPHFEALSFWERVFVPTWAWGGLVFFPPELVNHPRSPLVIGVGGFFLMRRRALERIGGFAAIRAEVLDDMRLAEILKASGARLLAEHAPALVRTRMYTNLAELWESSTKNWFAILKFSLILTAVVLAWIFSVAVLPPVLATLSGFMILLGGGGDAWRQLLIPSVAAWALHVSLLALVNRRCGVPALYALTAPLGFLLTCAVLLDSAFGVVSGRGVRWKGRRIYEREGLRPPKKK